MFKRMNPTFEHNSGVLHKDHEERNTRVSEYLRKYGQGKIDSMPTDNRPEVHDDRTVDEMLSEPNIGDHMSTDMLDALMEVERKKEDFEKAFADIELTKKQRQLYERAMATLDDKNASYDQIKDAQRILNELEQDKKITRARYK